MGRFLDRLWKLVGRGHPAKSSSGWSELWLQARESLFGSKTLTDPLAQHIWVYACVTKIARNVSAVPWVLYKGERRLTPRMAGGAALALFEYAEPNLVGPQLWERTAADMVYYGQAYWRLIRGRDGVTPARIEVLDPADVQGDTDGEGRVTRWRCGTRVFKPSDVVVLPVFRRDKSIFGLGPFSVSKETAEIDHKAMKWLDGVIDNRGDPGGVLYTDEVLDDEYVRVLRDRWNSRHAGPGKAGGLAVLDRGLKYDRIGLSADELEYLGLRRYTREDICAAFGVPQALLGVTEDVNYATHRALKRIFWEETIWPLLNQIQALVQYHILTPYFEGVRGEFDIREILELQRDVPQEVRSARVLFEMGFTANELNEWFRWGFDRQPWRDEPYVPANLVSWDDSQPGRPQVNPDYPGPTDDEPRVDYNEVLPEVLRAVKRRLKRMLYEVRGEAIRHNRLPDGFEDSVAFEVAKLFGLGGIPEAAGVACRLVRRMVRDLDEAVRRSNDVKRVLNWTSGRLGVVVQRIKHELEDGNDQEAT